METRLLSDPYGLSRAILTIGLLLLLIRNAAIDTVQNLLLDLALLQSC